MDGLVCVFRNVIVVTSRDQTQSFFCFCATIFVLSKAEMVTRVEPFYVPAILSLFLWLPNPFQHFSALYDDDLRTVNYIFTANFSIQLKIQSQFN